MLDIVICSPKRKDPAMGAKLTKLGNNQTEIVAGGVTTLYSYETPVVVTTHFAAGATIRRPVVYITNGAGGIYH